MSTINIFIQQRDNMGTYQVQINLFVQCKPCKLQSRPPDQHPRGMGDWIILQLTALLLSHFCKSPLPLPLRCPLDVDPMIQIEVCTMRLVCTWYIPFIDSAQNVLCHILYCLQRIEPRVEYKQDHPSPLPFSLPRSLYFIAWAGSIDRTGSPIEPTTQCNI